MAPSDPSARWLHDGCAPAQADSLARLESPLTHALGDSTAGVVCLCEPSGVSTLCHSVAGQPRHQSNSQEDMHVVHLADYGGPYPGSFVPALRTAAEIGAQRGWSTEVLLPSRAIGRSWADALAADLPVDFTPEASGRELVHWLGDLFATRSGNTLVHTHFTAFDVPAVMAAARHPSVAVVWHVHRSLPSKPGQALRTAVKYCSFGRRAAAVICVAPHVVEQAKRRGGPRGRLHCLPNGIDVQRFLPPTPDQRRRAREHLGLSSEDRVVLHFGWEWHTKGGDLFIQALDRLRSRGEAVTGLTVRGGDPAVALRDRLDLGERVRVAEATSDPRALYAAADVFATTSRSESGPFAMVEALCSGLPVVATGIPSQRFLSTGLANCSITSLDPEGIADGILELLNRTPADAKVAAETTRSQVVERLSLDVWGDRLLSIYDEAVAWAGLSPTPAAAQAR